MKGLCCDWCLPHEIMELLLSYVGQQTQQYFT
jgi:hypothetical protein